MLTPQRTCTALLFKVTVKCLKQHYAKLTKVSAITEYYHSFLMSCICCRWFFHVSQLKVQEPSGGWDESACGPPFSHTCILSTVLPASPEAVLCTAVGGTVFQHSPTESIKSPVVGESMSHHFPTLVQVYQVQCCLPCHAWSCTLTRNLNEGKTNRVDYLILSA